MVLFTARAENQEVASGQEADCARIQAYWIPQVSKVFSLLLMAKFHDLKSIKWLSQGYLQSTRVSSPGSLNPQKVPAQQRIVS